MTLLYPRMKRRLGLTACRLVLESRVTAMTTKRVWEAGGGAGGVLETYARRRREWPLLNLSVIPRGTELAGVISILTNEWVVERNVMSFHDRRCLWCGITCLSVANLGRIINKSVCHSGRMHLLHYNSNMNNCFISYNGFFDVTISRQCLPRILTMLLITRRRRTRDVTALELITVVKAVAEKCERNGVASSIAFLSLS